MDLMDYLEDRVSIVARGHWKEDVVKASIRSSCAPYIVPKLRDLAVQRYDERQKQREDSGLRMLDDNDVMHLCAEHSYITKKEAYLVMGKIKYSQYRIATAQTAKDLGLNMQDLLAGMGVSAVIITSDDMIVMMKPSSLVDFPNRISLPGGVYNGGHPFNAMQKEIDEEVGILANEMSAMVILGLSFRKEDCLAHILHFFARTQLSFDEVEQRWETALDRWEGEIFAQRCEKEALRSFLDRAVGDSDAVAAHCCAGLILTGRALWGEEWSRIV